MSGCENEWKGSTPRKITQVVVTSPRTSPNMCRWHSERIPATHSNLADDGLRALSEQHTRQCTAMTWNPYTGLGQETAVQAMTNHISNNAKYHTGTNSSKLVIVAGVCCRRALLRGNHKSGQNFWTGSGWIASNLYQTADSNKRYLDAGF